MSYGALDMLLGAFGAKDETEGGLAGGAHPMRVAVQVTLESAAP